MPTVSSYAGSKKPSAIRGAQIAFSQRKDRDSVTAINTAIGNVSRPMHPAMWARFSNRNDTEEPFKDRKAKYTPTVGMDECRAAFLHMIASSGFSTDDLYVHVTRGGSEAMGLVVLAVCGDPGTKDDPLLLLDPTYTNYNGVLADLGRHGVSVSRTLQKNGKFTLPDLEVIKSAIKEHSPGGLLVIPGDNPTGQRFPHKILCDLARFCVEHDLWMISDEAYWELYYTGKSTSSILGITEDDVPGISGRRVVLLSASKIFNACGLRIGGLVTDNEEFHKAGVAIATTKLCASIGGQHTFAAIANESREDLNEWYSHLRSYYQGMMVSFKSELGRLLPDVIVSEPEAALYSVVDVRDFVQPGFNAAEFVEFCAAEGKVSIDGMNYTLLAAPMAEFYTVGSGEKNPGDTQMRIAFVEEPETMAKVPQVFAELLTEYEQKRAQS